MVHRWMYAEVQHGNAATPVNTAVWEASIAFDADGRMIEVVRVTDSGPPPRRASWDDPKWK